MTTLNRTACLAGQCNDNLNEKFCERVLRLRGTGDTNYGPRWLASLPNCLTDISSLGHIAKAEARLATRDKHISSRPQDYPSLCYASALRKVVGAGLCAIVTKDGMGTYVDSSPFEGIKLICASPLHRVVALLDLKHAEGPEVWG